MSAAESLALTMFSFFLPFAIKTGRSFSFLIDLNRIELMAWFTRDIAA